MSTDVTALYDQELESLVWDDSEAKCEFEGGCEHGAEVRSVRPCGHGLLYCTEHAQRERASIDIVLAAGRGKGWKCRKCQAVTDLRDVRYVAI